MFPAIPDEDRATVVRHTCEVSSGRVGRTARAKALAAEPIRLAVRAHIRHEHTDYDARLRRAGFGQRFGRASREDRAAARKAVKKRIDAIFALWSGERVTVPPAEPAAPPPQREAPAEPAPAAHAPSRSVPHAAPAGAMSVPRAEPAAPVPVTRGQQLRLWERPLG